MNFQPLDFLLRRRAKCGVVSLLFRPDCRKLNSALTSQISKNNLCDNDESDDGELFHDTTSELSLNEEEDRVCGSRGDCRIVK